MMAADIENYLGMVGALNNATKEQRELNSAAMVFARYIAKMPAGPEQNVALRSLRNVVTVARQHGAE